ncbi:MAG: response regulator [Clostridiaceae bacterium]
MNKGISIAIMDDDQGIIDTLETFLSDKYYVQGFTSSKDGLAAIEKGDFDLLILDYFIDNLNGKEIVNEIRSFNPSIYITLLTGYAEKVPALQSLDEIDIQGYIEKTGDFEKIIIYIETIIKSIEFFKGNKVELNKKIGQRLKSLRKTNNLSQSDVANHLDVRTNSISQYESGATSLTIENVLKLAELFNVTTDYILCYTLNVTNKNFR